MLNDDYPATCSKQDCKMCRPDFSWNMPGKYEVKFESKNSAILFDVVADDRDRAIHKGTLDLVHSGLRVREFHFVYCVKV